MAGPRPLLRRGGRVHAAHPRRERPRKRRIRHGGGLARAGVEPDEIAAPEGRPLDELLAVDAALDRLAAADPAAAELVKLRYFAGLSIAESAAILGVSPRTADRLWTYARAWLRREIPPE